MWEIVYGIISFIIGLFLWSTIFGKLIEIQQIKRANLPYNMFLSLVSILAALMIITIGSYYSAGFMIGAILSGVVMVFNLGKLKQEVTQSIQKKHGQ